MKDDQELEALLKSTAGLYNPPPETPRDKMWTRIDAERRSRRGRRRPRTAVRILRHPGVAWPMAAAAVLLLGIALGRFSLRDGRLDDGAAVAPPVVADRGQGVDRLYGPLAAAVFGKAEALLTDVCAGGEFSDPENPLPLWAGSLLLQTRLLLDTPAAEQSDVKSLLEDLELVLAQIVQAGGSNQGEDCKWIIGGLQQRATLTRLRTRNLAGRNTEPL